MTRRSECSGLLDDQDRRPERLSAAARRSHDPGPDEATVGGGRRPEPLPPRTLYLLLARDAASVLDDLRCSRRRAVVHAAIAIQHAASGPDALERPGLDRDRPGTGRAHPGRTAGPATDRDRLERAFLLCLGPPGVRERAQDARDRARAGACRAETRSEGESTGKAVRRQLHRRG